jgi:hypothetical protein
MMTVLAGSGYNTMKYEKSTFEFDETLSTRVYALDDKAEFVLLVDRQMVINGQYPVVYLDNGLACRMEGADTTKAKFIGHPEMHPGEGYNTILNRFQKQYLEHRKDKSMAKKRIVIATLEIETSAKMTDLKEDLKCVKIPEGKVNQVKLQVAQQSKDS